MKRLSKDVEDRLLSAIEKTAALVNEGEDPNSAIAKVAMDDGIAPGQVSLVVHAYNTGRTTRQRQQSDSPLEKAAEFPLADAATVLELMYPTKTKTASVRAHDVAVSPEYLLSPTGILNRRARRELLKQGSNIDWRTWSQGGETVTAEAPEPYAGDPAWKMKKAYCEAERLQREVQEARRKEAQAFDKMAEVFNQVTDYFRSPTSLPIPVVQEQAFLLHGGKGRQLIDEVVKVTPGLAKFSHHKVDPGVSNYRLASTGDEVYGMISEFLDCVDDYKRCKQAHADALRTNSERSEALLSPFADRPADVLEELGYSTKPVSKAASVMAPIIGASAIKSLMSGPASKTDPGAVNSALSQLTDPTHEAELRNIRSQAMMQDLMANDPIISGYDPQETIQAFNDVAAMAPRAVDKRLLMQSLLRKRLEQGALDTFETGELLGMEQKQKQLDEPTPQPAAPGPGAQPSIGSAIAGMLPGGGKPKAAHAGDGDAFIQV